MSAFVEGCSWCGTPQGSLGAYRGDQRCTCRCHPDRPKPVPNVWREPGPPKPYHPLTDEDRGRIVERHDAGETMVAIARDYDLSPTSISFVVNKARPERRVALQAERAEQEARHTRIVELRAAGWTYKRIATEVERSVETVRQHLVKEGRKQRDLLGRERAVRFFHDDRVLARRLVAEIGEPVGAVRAACEFCDKHMVEFLKLSNDGYNLVWHWRYR